MRRVATVATRVLAICDKCGKKLDGGFGDDDGRPLGKALKRLVSGTRGKRRTVRIIGTRCLDLCPKGAVAMLDSRQPGVIFVVARGTDPALVCDQLVLPMVG